MTITLKSAREIAMMADAGRIVANALQEMRSRVEPGMTTGDLDAIAEAAIRRQGAVPAFPYINDFPGTACISVNDEVVHGIPGKRVLHDGDLVKLDVGAIYRGWHGDAAVTVPVGSVNEDALKLVRVTEEALARGIEAAQPGAHLNDIGATIEDFVKSFGFSVVRQYVGHGIGRELHEDPNVPHYRQAMRGVKLKPGMTLNIEPMVNAGTYETRLLSDEWTVVTADGRLSAQFEHTIAITEDGPRILTIAETGETWSIPFLTSNKVQ